MSRVGETKKVVVPVRVRPVRRMGEDILRGLEKNGEDGKGSKGSTKLATRCAWQIGKAEEEGLCAQS